MAGKVTFGNVPALTWGCVGGGGAAGAALALFGHPGWGGLLWAGAALGALLGQARHRRGPPPANLEALAAAVAADPDHPQAALLGDVQALAARVEGHGEDTRQVVRTLQEHATLVAWVLDTLNESMGEAQEALTRMQQVMGSVASHAAEVRTASQSGMELIESMGARTEDLFAGAETLNRSVEEATESVAQIHGALAEVQQGVAILSESSDRSTDFIVQVGEAMGGIRARIEQNLELSSKVETYARKGRQAVGQVGDGIDKIQQSSRAMVESVQALSRQSREIEGVLGIITDVAEETSLLSLNAAILAAQAGERGAAFGVVADQIRSLAQRTRESTRHIEALVRGIQANITEANVGLAGNLEAVEEGHELGRDAVRQLQLIEEGVGEAVEEVRGVARAAQDQDEKARTMVSAAGEINESLHHVAENLGQSILEMGRMNSLIQSLGALSQSVRAAADDHRSVGRETAELMGSFSERVEGILGFVETQSHESSTLVETLEKVTESGDTTRESLGQIHTIVKQLVSLADRLRDEFAAFRAAPEARAEEDGDAN